MTNVTNQNQSLVKCELRYYFIRLTIYNLDLFNNCPLFFNIPDKLKPKYTCKVPTIWSKAWWIASWISWRFFKQCKKIQCSCPSKRQNVMTTSQTLYGIWLNGHNYIDTLSDVTRAGRKDGRHRSCCWDRIGWEGQRSLVQNIFLGSGTFVLLCYTPMEIHLEE